MALTINDYLTSVRCEPGIVRAVLEENIKFEFWELCLDELKRYRFTGEDNEEALELISRVSEIIDLFQAPKVSRDDVMMMAFPFSLKRKALTWVKKAPSGDYYYMGFFKKGFSQRISDSSQDSAATRSVNDKASK